MGRITLAEKSTCEATVQNLLSVSVDIIQFGLLIGKFGEDGTQKDYVIHMAPTPDDEEFEKNCQKPASSQVSWINAHAKQVVRMLVGGLDIIGLFVVCPSDAFEHMKTDIQKALIQIDKVSERSTLNVVNRDSSQEYTVLHICSKTKKLSSKIINIADKMASFRQADWKVQTFLNQWTKLKTSCNLQMPYLSTLPSNKQQAYMKLQSGIRQLCEKVMESKCCIGGELYDELIPLSTLLLNPSKGKRIAESNTGNLNINMYISECYVEKEGDVDVTFVVYSGCVEALAYIPNKSFIKDALKALKTDVIRTIVGRFRILYEDILETNDDELIGCLLPPKRTLIIGETQAFTDYVFESETVDDVKGRLSEILSIIGEGTEMTSLEQTPDPNYLENITSPRCRPVDKTCVSTIENSQSRRNVRAATGLIVAGVAAVCSILIGRMLLE